jgi:hypothetical protein
MPPLNRIYDNSLLDHALEPLLLQWFLSDIQVLHMLLDICFANDDFNYMSIFGFLEEEHVEYPILILLEDVLLPIVRKTPHKVKN